MNKQTIKNSTDRRLLFELLIWGENASQEICIELTKRHSLIITKLKLLIISIILGNPYMASYSAEIDVEFELTEKQISRMLWNGFFISFILCTLGIFILYQNKIIGIIYLLANFGVQLWFGLNLFFPASKKLLKK